MSTLRPPGGPVRNVRRSSPPPPPSEAAEPSDTFDPAPGGVEARSATSEPGAPRRSEAPGATVSSRPPSAAVSSRPPRRSVAPPSAAVSSRPPAPRRASRVFAALRAVLGVLMVVAIGSGAVWGARKYVRTSPRFAVNEIVTAGGKRRSAEEIALIAGVGKGQNVFTIDLERSRARLTADPWIESAEVGRQLPGTLTIRVVEREAAGLVAMPEGTYLVTRDGAVIKRVEAGDPLDFHVVTGVALKSLVEDREGAVRTIRRALDLALDYDRSPLAQRSPLEEVHVEATGDMTLIAGKSGVVLRMGSGPYKRKLDQAARIVGELDRRGAKPDTIMLDDEARPDRVVVRMR
ncbi:MAG: FtsQ-type POTRA domain-containing protein [Labilithrix sp.]|nr:FtsQ-type POTRA domain-containing protein [Labilithrix sp.]MCW5811973.1 FtsQ-type POTRA domain-containing protein [Labilithrix sp.]